MSVLGSVVGFLSMNIHPSKLFMGDAGSQFIGLFVAFFGIKFLWNIGTADPGNVHPSWLGMCITLIAFTPTAADTLTVVINRLRKGKSPMVGGKDHTTHHLVYAGLSDRSVWLVFVGIGFLASLISIVLVHFVTMNTYLPVAFFVFYFVFVFVLLYRNTIKYPAPEKKK